MSAKRSAPALGWLAALLALITAHGAWAAPLGGISSASPLSNGVELHSGPVTMRITALRDDLVRIQVSRGPLAEHGSWAVLARARSAAAKVQPFADAAAVGFSTPALQVRVSRAASALTITDAAGRTILADAPEGGVEFDGAGFKVSKALPADEHIFGLGDKTGSLDRREHAFVLWNTDRYGYQESDDPIYKSIPFFMGFQKGRAYGLLLDNTFRSTFDFGKAKADTLSLGAEDGPLDYYVMTGPSPKEVEAEYVWLTGPAPLPPLWSFGYQQSRYSYGTEQEVRAVTSRLRAERIPADVVWLDIDYQDRNRPFTIDRSRFPDMPKLLSDLAAEGFHAVLITDLHIADAPGQGYLPYDTGAAGDHFLHNPDGSVYVGPVWPGPSVFPEFTRERTRAWWGGLYRPFYGMGASGFWNDMNEPSVFNDIKTIPSDVQDRIEEPGFASRTTTQREIHNVYGMLNSRATFEGLLAIKPDRRPFVMTRASYAGGQRYAVTWTGDNSSTWNHLRLSTPMLLNLGLSGFAFAGDDLGGFAGSPPADLLTRWLELGMFNPIARDHTVKGSLPQEPWVNGEPHTSIRRRYIEERYRLLPYIYTLAEETSRTGVPMMRPLFIEFPQAAGGEPLDLTAPGQFMWGADLMVAPQPFGEQPAPYAVTLPPGGWYDYWTGQKVEAQPSADGTAQITVAPKLDVLPVYVRAGAIIPRQPLVQSTNERPNGPLQLDVYPGPDCRGALYQDAGDGFGYRHGEFYRTEFRCQVSPSGLVISRGPAEGRFRPWWTEIRVVVHDQAAARAVSGGRTLSAAYDPAGRTVAFNATEKDLASGVALPGQLSLGRAIGLPGSGRAGSARPRCRAPCRRR